MKPDKLAEKFVREMGACNGCVFTPTEKQWQQLHSLCSSQAVQRLSRRDFDTLIDGEYTEQAAIARRNEPLKRLHRLLGHIFDGPIEEARR